MCSNSRRSGVSASGQGATTWTICTSFLTRQGALTARSVRRLAPSEAADQQLLLAAKGHPGRLKALTDEPEVLPLPPAQSLTPTRPPEPAAAQDTAAGPAPATPAGGSVESKHCEIEQSEEKMKTDTRWRTWKKNERHQCLGSGGDHRLDTSLLPVPKTIRPIATDAQEGPTITSKHARTTRSRRRESS